MRPRSQILAVALSLVAAAPVAAQDPAALLGSWELTFPSPRGEQTMTVTFSMEDGELTGVAEGPRGKSRSETSKWTAPTCPSCSAWVAGTERSRFPSRARSTARR